jgi:hypothetical protein
LHTIDAQRSVPAQTPLPSHTSFSVAGSSSLHAVPLANGVSTHAPKLLSHTLVVWHVRVAQTTSMHEFTVGADDGEADGERLGPNVSPRMVGVDEGSIVGAAVGVAVGASEQTSHA